MDSHALKDQQYHADIARVYDYITNEPRQYPNELLFRPIDRLLKPAGLLLDLGCGTGQMFLRHGHLAGQIIAVDHSKEMLAEAAAKSKSAGLEHVTFVEQDLDEFLDLNQVLRADLITCVGVLHHLNQEGLLEFLKKIHSILKPQGQLLIAEPIYSSRVPEIVHARNRRSILIKRLQECMPPETTDPDEEPLHEAALVQAIGEAGFRIRKKSRGFELFHVTDPLSFTEKLIIRSIYALYANGGDVIAVLLEKNTLNANAPPGAPSARV